jgi:NAD(P)-dependent dehydrogenase (short-subunit alcohol dehydrogenase family)
VIGDVADPSMTVADLSTTHPNRRIVGTRLDVRDGASIDACADLAVREFGRLDIWVNNAGIYPTAPLLDLTDDDWNQVLEVNLRGTFVGAREAARRMIDAGHGGVILNIASTAAYQASSGPGLTHYVSSKHAVLGLTKSLAVELGPLGIRALAIAPTLIDTPGIEAACEGKPEVRNLIDSYTQKLPLGRGGVTDDVARVAVFAASDLAMFMTGSTLLVDAGDVAV